MLFRDGFPVLLGYTLVIPKRHVDSIFELGQEEIQAMMALLKKAKVDLDKEFNPDGHNIGVDDGPQAWQTVLHVHIHLIPRYQGMLKIPEVGSGG